MCSLLFQYSVYAVYGKFPTIVSFCVFWVLNLFSWIRVDLNLLVLNIMRVFRPKRTTQQTIWTGKTIKTGAKGHPWSAQRCFCITGNWYYFFWEDWSFEFWSIGENVYSFLKLKCYLMVKISSTYFCPLFFWKLPPFSWLYGFSFYNLMIPFLKLYILFWEICTQIF